MGKILHADQRRKQNHKEENLLIIHRASFRWMKESGLILNQVNILSPYEVSKKVTHLLRHSQQMHREEDGAVHFWRKRKIFRANFHSLSIGLTIDGKACLAAGWGAKRRFHYCPDDSGAIVYFRALQGHSGRNLMDLSLQDNVVIPSKNLPIHLPYRIFVLIIL